MITEISEKILKRLESISQATGQGLTHFFPLTCIRKSPISGKGRFALEAISQGALVGVVGGILVNTFDNQRTLPIGKGIYLDQLFMNQRATTNHSCNPTLKLEGFNKLVAKSDIRVDEELTVDYGSLSVGNGSIVIENCLCGFEKCRKVIKTNDYLLLPKSQLGTYALWEQEHSAQIANEERG